MKRFYLIWILFICSMFASNLASAKSSDRTLTKHEKIILYLILQNTNEVNIHQMGGQTGNQVMLGPNGHKEAVYNSAGTLVRDGINDGSYNYNHPVEEPLLHFSNDIHPWIMMGASRGDTTSKKQRIYAYMGDLEGGVRRAQLSRAQISELEQTLTFTEEQESIFLLWGKIVKKEKTYALFSYFELDRPMTDEETLSVMKALYKGFKSAY